MYLLILYNLYNYIFNIIVYKNIKIILDKSYKTY